MEQIKGAVEVKRILAFVGDVYEDLELWYPKLRLEEEGWRVIVAGLEADTEYKGKNGYPCISDMALHDVDANQFDALLIPGGFMPDKLRRHEKVKQVTREFNEKNQPIGFICHAGWICISAGIIAGRRATSTIGIKDDMINAGCDWVDEPLVVDGNLISSRTPIDLPVFAKALVDRIAPS